QRKLASLSGMSQGLISLIENGERTITPETDEILRSTFEVHP
ncbi:MAG: helix-turn-helix domain-containing protein, partial [Synechococcales cyanobacterium]